MTQAGPRSFKCDARKFPQEPAACRLRGPRLPENQGFLATRGDTGRRPGALTIVSGITNSEALGLVDPFGGAANASSYVPREATERVLGDLEQALLGGAACALLVGDAGLGKSLLLRVLEQRLERECATVYLPYPALPLGSLCSWACSALGLVAGEDPAGRLLEFARRGREGRSGLVLLIDDIGDVPDATLVGLAGLIELSGGSLRLAGCVDPEGAYAVADLWLDGAAMRLLEPMSLEDCRQYVHTLLRRANAPAPVLRAFGDCELARLHAAGEGVPSRMNSEAVHILRHLPEPQLSS